LEYALRSKWNRPADLPDDKYVAEVDVNVSRAGDISNPIWRKSSRRPEVGRFGAGRPSRRSRVDRPRRPNFPSQVLVRFDVLDETEPISQ